MEDKQAQVKEAVSEAPKVEAPKVEAPKVEAPAVKVEAPKVDVPQTEITEAPAWRLTKEEWDASQKNIASLAERIPVLGGVMETLSPLIDAINDVTREEAAPQKKKPWFRRKLGS